MALDKKAREMLERYNREVSFRRIFNICGISAAFLAALLIGMVLSGDTFKDFLAMLGLKGMYNRETGVYANCSDSANRDIAYCQKKNKQSDKDWSTIRDTKGKSVPFNLNSNR